MKLLTLDQENLLKSSPALSEHLKRRHDYYLEMVRQVKASFPQFKEEIDIVDFVKLMIKKSDQDIFGVSASAGLPVDEVCDLFARSVVGEDQ